MVITQMIFGCLVLSFSFFTSCGGIFGQNAMEDAEMEDVENSSPNALAELSVIFAICAGKAGRCGIAYVDLDENERVLYVADVMDPEFIHLDRNTAADRLYLQSCAV